MKLERLEVFQMGTSWRNLIIARVTTDTGITGLGDATIQWGDEAVVAYLPRGSFAPWRQDAITSDSMMLWIAPHCRWRSRPGRGCG